MKFTVLGLILLIAGCSRLGLFNAVIPKDPASLEIGAISYGPDPRQKLDIYRPANEQGAGPVIVFVYGGSWNSGDRREYAFAARALASRGYTTVVFDYRLVPEHRYPVFVEDTAAAIAWTYHNVGRYGGNPKRLYVVGHSAGAYNAMMAALSPKFLRAEGLSPGVIDAVVGLSGPYDFLPLDVDESREAFKGVSDLPPTQPVYWARSGGKPPAFLATGEADEFVRPKNTKSLAAALRASGNSVTTKYYPGIDHVGTLLALSRPLRDNAPVLDDVVGFLKRH